MPILRGEAAVPTIIHHNDAAAMQVTVMENNKSYGGSEEGGWWYDTATVVDRHLCYNRVQVEEAIEYFNEMFSNEGRYDLSSVCCSGIYTIHISYAELHDEPTYRPHYE
jgi:hypothetical protein